VKAIATILSVLFLMLSMLPCADDEVNDNGLAEIHIQHQHEHTDAELCSPFCQCLCCVTNVVTNYNLVNPSLLVHQQLAQVIYFDILGKDIVDSLLHPPQV